MHRKADQDQRHRSNIWKDIFTLEPIITQPANGDIPSTHCTLPLYPSCSDATVIQTNLKLASSGPSPCNANNRKTWTAIEREKASGAKHARSRGFLNAVSVQLPISASILHFFIHFLSFYQLQQFHKNGQRKEGEFMRIPNSLYAG